MLATRTAQTEPIDSELQDGDRAEVRRRRAFWIMQVARLLQGRLGSSTYRSAGIRVDQIDAQASDNSLGVVFVQAVEGEAVVEKSGGLTEHLSSHLEVDFGPCLGDCIGGRHEGIEGRALGARRHTLSVSAGPCLSKQI